ncbi:MAG TPA: transketolase C-terminal domain-containing protein [Patescibacteria group bacterium]|nr:transketolase C-terminal domain-containing protein [Patescibacteria group bacterium]
MLNPYLKLNPKVFDKENVQKPTRDGFGDALVELGEKNENVVVLTADLSESTRTDGFEKKFPERFFEAGVAEQNMAAVAAGLAVSGKIPFISSYATFSPGKNWETIRTTIIYNQASVKIAGHHSGVITGPDGSTHQATEDIAIVRSWPGIQILVPCDAIEAKKATIESVKFKGPSYLRFTREKTPIITTEQTSFKPVSLFWTSEVPRAVIFATGHMIYHALLAARELEKEKIEVLVANVAQIKPLDEKTILDLVKKAGKVVTVEDHQIMGGLGGAISELLAKHSPAPMEFVGLQDTFAESGKPQELMEKYKMDHKAIISAVKKVVRR